MEEEFQNTLDRAYRKRDLVRLKKLCLDKDGLRTDENRRKVWPLLLKIYEPDQFMVGWKKPDLACSYTDIIGLDVNRSLFGLDLTDTYTDEERNANRVELDQILNGIFMHKPELHYSQGFHAICTPFYLIGGQDLGFKMSMQCAQLFIKDSLRANFDQGVVPACMLFYDLLRKIDIELAEKIENYYKFDDELTLPMFCFPWIITWLGQDIYSFKHLCRVYDFFLATHPLATIYISVVIILHEKSYIMETNDMSEIHQHCGRVVDSLDINAICAQAYQLMQQIQPKKLLKESGRVFPADSPVSVNNDIEAVFHAEKIDKIITYSLGAAVAALAGIVLLKSG